MLIVINYHYIRPSFDAPYPSIYGVTPAQFQAQLETLGRLGHFVSAAQIRAAVRGQSSLPPRAILVTFDDGLQEQFEYAWPILRRLGMPAIFFANTAGVVERRVLAVHKIHLVRAQMAPRDLLRLLERQAAALGIGLRLPVDHTLAGAQYGYDSPEAACLKYLLNFRLTPTDRDRLIEAAFQELFPDGEAALSRKLYLHPAQIRVLGSQGCIGSHAHDHLPLGLLEPELAEEQIRLAQEFLEDWGGYRPFAFSYPYGSREAGGLGVGELAARHGIEFAFTIECAGNAWLRQPLRLARCDCNDLPGGKAPKWSADKLFETIPAASWFEPAPAYVKRA